MLTKMLTVFQNHFKTGFKFAKYFSFLFIKNFIPLSFKPEKSLLKKDFLKVYYSSKFIALNGLKLFINQIELTREII